MFRKIAKGDSPKLHLKLEYYHNPIRSAVTVFLNKEENLFEVEKPKFERAILLRNFNRIKQFLPKSGAIQRMKNSYSDIIAWKDPARTVKYFIFYMFWVYYFQIWWIPVFLLYHLSINWKKKKGNLLKKSSVTKTMIKNDMVEEEDEEDEDSQEQEEKKSLKQSLDSLQNILLELQEGCGLLASYFERVFNLFHFEVPFLTFLFGTVLLITSAVLWLVGLRSVTYHISPNKNILNFSFQKSFVAVGHQ